MAATVVIVELAREAKEWQYETSGYRESTITWIKSIKVSQREAIISSEKREIWDWNFFPYITFFFNPFLCVRQCLFFSNFDRFRITTHVLFTFVENGREGERKSADKTVSSTLPLSRRVSCQRHPFYPLTLASRRRLYVRMVGTLADVNVGDDASLTRQRGNCRSRNRSRTGNGRTLPGGIWSRK